MRSIRGDNAGAAEEIGEPDARDANAPRSSNAMRSRRCARRATIRRALRRGVARLAASRGLDLKVMPPEAIEELVE